jgi:hypothetical protein
LATAEGAILTFFIVYIRVPYYILLSWAPQLLFPGTCVYVIYMGATMPFNE